METARTEAIHNSVCRRFKSAPRHHKAECDCGPGSIIAPGSLRVWQPIWQPQAWESEFSTSRTSPDQQRRL